jgi:hypothetical protein
MEERSGGTIRHQPFVEPGVGFLRRSHGGGCRKPNLLTASFARRTSLSASAATFETRVEASNASSEARSACLAAASARVAAASARLVDSWTLGAHEASRRSASAAGLRFTLRLSCWRGWNARRCENRRCVPQGDARRRLIARPETIFRNPSLCRANRSSGLCRPPLVHPSGNAPACRQVDFGARDKGM